LTKFSLRRRSRLALCADGAIAARVPHWVDRARNPRNLASTVLEHSTRGQNSRITGRTMRRAERPRALPGNASRNCTSIRPDARRCSSRLQGIATPSGAKAARTASNPSTMKLRPLRRHTTPARSIVAAGNETPPYRTAERYRSDGRARLRRDCRPDSSRQYRRKTVPRSNVETATPSATDREALGCAAWPGLRFYCTANSAGDSVYFPRESSCERFPPARCAASGVLACCCAQVSLVNSRQKPPRHD